MDFFEIVIIIGIILIIYNYYNKNNTENLTIYKNNENFDGNLDDTYYKYDTYDNSDNLDNLDNHDLVANNKNYYIKNPKKYIDHIINIKNKTKLNPYFQEMQYHVDYKDTVNAITNMIQKKQIFNKANLPVTKIDIDINDKSNKAYDEVKTLIVTFINKLNKFITQNKEITLSGWFNFTQDKNIKSGWDKQQEKLGLPTSIYDEPNTKKTIICNLLKIDKIEKYETSDEIRYIIYLILNKKNVKDQMIVRVNFIVEKQDLNLDREFFDSDKNNYETKVKIEEIFIVGFLTNNINDYPNDRKDFYNFKTVSYKGLVDDKNIIVELNKKRKQYMKEKI